MPDTIELRKNFFIETERNCFIAKSALDFSWSEDIPQGDSTLFIAEGLTCYFTESENKAIISAIKQNYPGAEYVFETVHPFFLKMSKQNNQDGNVRNKVFTFMRWGVKSGKELESWFNGVQLVKEWFVVNSGKDKFPILYRVLFFLLPILTRSKIIILLRFT